MATFDQLPADQRAIIELLLKRRRTYDALSDMLDMPASRVRELARDALTELAPHTADRVDPDWQAQVADYALGQQSGPESQATQGHLKRSEPARAWLLSLMDSLDQLYTNGTRPEIPAAEGERPRARDRKERGADRGRDRRERDKSKGAAAVVDREADDKDEDEDGDDKAKDAAKRPTPLTGGRRGGPLSPAARSVVMRRRLIGGGVALLALIVAVLILTGVLFGGDDGDKNSKADNGSQTTTNANKPPTQLIGQLQLNPLDKSDKNTIGVAAIAKTGDKMQLAVQAKLPPRTGAKEAYEVWLYNSKDDAVSIGAQRTDAQGNYQGAGDIPVDYTKYKYIDISAEKIDRNPAHSGDSVLRGAIADLVTPQQQQQQQQGGQGQGGAAPGTQP
jgi:hypothetical protein